MYQSVSFIYRFSLRTLHQESHRTAKTRIELQPPISVCDIGNRLSYRWFSSTTTPVEDDNTTSNCSKRPNAFRLFSLPLSFKIDEDMLRTKYHDYMKILHPDKQNSESESDSTDDATVASITNSYNILKRPHLRAMHLLKIMKYAQNDPSASHKDFNDDDHSKHLTDPSKDFLLEVMDLQEYIHLMDNDEDLKPIFDDNVQRINDTCEKLQKAFEASDVKEFQNLAIKLKYWTRIDETLRNKMTSLE
jgi:molecular chaperone HscB